MRIVEQYLAQLNIEKRRWRRATAILTVLSLFVAAGVAWNLRMTGITLVNDACCGYEEHRHTEECMTGILCCDYKEVEQALAATPLTSTVYRRDMRRTTVNESGPEMSAYEWIAQGCPA